MKRQLKICNMGLLLLAPAVLASGTVLECVHCEPFCGVGNAWWTWLHVVLSFAMTAMVAWHVRLNWQGAGRWLRRFRAHRSPQLKATVVLYLLTSVTGALIVPLWLHSGHTGFGGLHGKIGFASAFCILLHIVRRRRWYSGKGTNAA